MKTNHTFLQIIGAGSVDPCNHRKNSGLLLVTKGKTFIIDVTPQNWNEYGDWFYHPETTFFTTHGHMDHFNPEQPWIGIFHPTYPNFGDDNQDRHLFCPESVINLMLTYFGLTPGETATDNRSKYKKLDETHHILQRLSDKRTLHLHTIPLGKSFNTGETKVTPFDSLHDWTYSRNKNWCSKKGKCAGYIFQILDKNILYMPDFKVDTKGILRENIIQATGNNNVLDYFIVGSTNPVKLETMTPHSGPKGIFDLYSELKRNKIISDSTVIIITHRNTNWEKYDFVNPGFPDDKLIIAENGMKIELT